MNTVVDRIKMAAEKDPKLQSAATRLLCTMAEKATMQGKIVIMVGNPATRRGSADQESDPTRIAKQYVQRIRRARSVKQVRQLELAALEAIAAAKEGRRK